MDLAQGLGKVEIFVLFFGCNADVAAGGQAPVVGFDFGAIYEFNQSFYIAQFRFGETPGEPLRLLVEVVYLFELFDSDLSRLVCGSAGAGDVAPIIVCA